jgi:CrcB protein
MKQLLILGSGGFAGTILRYWVQLFFARHLPILFPIGTFVVNITGCFIIGLLYGIANRHDWLGADWRLFLITGFCGGYTTFSAFAFEGVSMLKQGHWMPFMLYTLLSVMVGILATMLGYALTK